MNCQQGRPYPPLHPNPPPTRRRPFPSPTENSKSLRDIEFSVHLICIQLTVGRINAILHYPPQTFLVGCNAQQPQHPLPPLPDNQQPDADLVTGVMGLYSHPFLTHTSPLVF